MEYDDYLFPFELLYTQFRYHWWEKKALKTSIMDFAFSSFNF